MFSSASHLTRWRTLVPHPILTALVKEILLSLKRGRENSAFAGHIGCARCVVCTGCVGYGGRFPIGLIWVFMVTILELTIWGFIYDPEPGS